MWVRNDSSGAKSVSVFELVVQHVERSMRTGPQAPSHRRNHVAQHRLASQWNGCGSV